MMKKSPEKAREEDVRRKQIESTLNELHRLQSQIYDLNIPENPHSSAPVKKEVKQLTYLYENMIKPKTKNNLNIDKEDIVKAIQFIEGIDEQQKAALDSKKLGTMMKKIFGADLQVGLIRKGDNKACKITSEELYQFINFNEFDGFDPIRETYNMFVDDFGRFNLQRYREMHQLMGLPPISRESTLREALGLGESDDLSYEKFQEILMSKDK